MAKDKDQNIDNVDDAVKVVVNPDVWKMTTYAAVGTVIATQLALWLATT